MATKYTVVMADGLSVTVEADGYRIKEDGWIHFYKDGLLPDYPKVTRAGFGPNSNVLWITEAGTPWEKLEFPDVLPDTSPYDRIRKCINEDIEIVGGGETDPWVRGMRNAFGIVGMVQDGLR